jgi:hypothetical protein
MATAGTKAPVSVRACVTPSGLLRIQGSQGCPKHTKALALSVTGAPGAAGAPGAPGAAGAAGSQGPTGPAGATGTPDSSLFYTKTAADSRFVKKSTELDVPGQAFAPVVGSAVVNRADFFGMYETGARQYAMADLEALPSGSTITSVDFLIVHASGTQTEMDIVDTNPAAGTSSAVVQDQHTTIAAGIQTVTLTPSGGGYTPQAGHAPVLFWNPANQSSDDIIWGARVHYTAP